MDNKKAQLKSRHLSEMTLLITFCDNCKQRINIQSMGNICPNCGAILPISSKRIQMAHEAQIEQTKTKSKRKNKEKKDYSVIDTARI